MTKAVSSLLFLLLLTTGCSSIRTNMWTRAGDDSLHPDPCDRLKGVPVMLKVPSHVEVMITETLYARLKTDHFEVVKLSRPELHVDATLKYTEKMFLVDPVRVAAGSGNYGFNFAPATGDPAIVDDNKSSSGHGYLHSASYKAQDQTIVQSANLLTTILNFNKVALPKGDRAGTMLSDDANTEFTKIKRTVAFRRFDLGDEGVDDAIMAFLEQHMNQCNVCAGCPRQFIDDTITIPKTSSTTTRQMTIDTAENPAPSRNSRTTHADIVPPPSE